MKRQTSAVFLLSEKGGREWSRGLKVDASSNHTMRYIGITQAVSSYNTAIKVESGVLNCLNLHGCMDCHFLPLVTLVDLPVTGFCPLESGFTTGALVAVLLARVGGAP